MSGSYWDADPAAPSAPRSVQLRLPDITVDLLTDRGVFGASAVDRGTQLLLRRADRPAAATGIVDLGTGYGPIATVLASRQPQAGVWAVDVNRRALALTRHNAAALDNVVTAVPAEVPPGLRFDALYSNPPIKIGKEPLHELLSDWLGRLAPGGAGWLVVKQSMGADSLQRWLIDAGHRTGRVASKQGYRVLKVDAGGEPGGRLDAEDLAVIAADSGRSWTVMGRVSGLFAGGVQLLRHRNEFAALKVRTGEAWVGQFARSVPVVTSLREQGYPVPAVLGTGALPEERAYSLTEWVPGETRCRGDRAGIESLVEAAAIHTDVHPPADRDWSAMVTLFLNGGVRQFAFHPVLAALAERTLALLPKPVPALPTGDFVHGDFSVANAIFRKNELRGIIDLEGFGRGTPAIDLIALAAHSDRDLQRWIIDRAIEVSGPEVVTACLCHRILAGLAWATEHETLLGGAAGHAAELLALIPD